MEILHDNGFEGCRFLLEIPVTGYLPFDLYDEGDIWTLYEPKVYFGREEIERLRPKKTSSIQLGSGYTEGLCPVCESKVVKGEPDYSYCVLCGQELNWNS